MNAPLSDAETKDDIFFICYSAGRGKTHLKVGTDVGGDRRAKKEVHLEISGRGIRETMGGRENREKRCKRKKENGKTRQQYK